MTQTQTTTETNPDTITELMDRDPLDLSSGDIERIIAYHRKNREAGPRPKKETGPTAKLDLASIGLGPKTPTKLINRRV